ncbi:MAG: hypothetical protein K8R91_00410 [Phycisphaerae bacterium]|nr:hypothetical protein [Phycisphaerae bacterium]
MGAILSYFRQHRWQRRAVTGMAAAILGVVSAWVAMPIVRDLQIIDMLGAEDPLQRRHGITLAISDAPHRPELIKRIESRLDSAGDVQFSAMVDVLNRMGKFRTPARNGEQLDRFYLIKFAARPDADDEESVEVRQILLHRIILDGRDNVHVRKALLLSAGDASAPVRSDSALLAGRLGDDETLSALLGDAAGRVRASAAIDAALVGRTACLGDIIKIFDARRSDEELAAAAYALTRMEPKRFASQIAREVLSAHKSGKGDLTDKLLHVLSLHDKDAAGQTVMELLKDARLRGKIPSASALIAAGKLELAEAAPYVRAAVTDLISRRDKLTVGDTATLAAAVNAARRLELPPKLFVEVMENLWHRETSIAMVLAAEALGRQREIIAKNPTLMTRVLTALHRGAERSDTPTPAAAAATAMFALAGREADKSLQTACESETYLAGDYVTWNLARSGDADAWRIAEVLFGPGIYNKAVRANGTILLALLGRGTEKANRLAEIIESRLIGQRDQFAAGSCHCALLILNRRQYIDKVAALTESESFGRRRVLTALALAGAPTGFDRVFAGGKFNPDRIDSYLTGLLMCRVYSVVAEEMPAFDLDAAPHIRYWQCRIWRDYYLIHRRSILGKIQL